MAKIFRIGRRRINLDFVVSFSVENSDVITRFWDDGTEGGRGLDVRIFPGNYMWDFSETEAKAAGWEDIDALVADLEAAFGAD